MALTTDRNRFDRAAQNWASAVRMYRMSVDLYNRVLQTRGTRLTKGEDRPSTPAVAPTNELAIGGPKLSEGSLALDGLTAREREVASLIAQGYTNRQIAEQLVITRGTAANHVAHILQKFGVANRTQVAASLLAAGSAMGAEPTPQQPIKHGDDRVG
jgi:DNA-binding NarL/FixJ family response regulator